LAFGSSLTSIGVVDDDDDDDSLPNVLERRNMA
jgi:hypothetical protein